MVGAGRTCANLRALRGLLFLQFMIFPGHAAGQGVDDRDDLRIQRFGFGFLIGHLIVSGAVALSGEAEGICKVMISRS
jgi:hypothetical protein